MGDAWSQIPDDIRSFMECQKLFFVATAPKDGRVNLSPKGLATLRIIDSKTIAYLDLTGSGNETAAHVIENGRITFMFCAFNGDPIIVRLYGQARIILPGDDDWESMIGLFPKFEGTRQIFLASVQAVSTSCGWGIPIFELKEERPTLSEWARKMGPDRLEIFKADYNALSIDGLPTGTIPEDF
nr:pyridoxamine 5'-phosphate oxidase family protein [uncultured Dongia sp.]